MEQAPGLSKWPAGVSITMEDLAEQSIDDLLDIEGIDEKRKAGELIMTARASPGSRKLATERATERRSVNGRSNRRTTRGGGRRSG